MTKKFNAKMLVCLVVVFLFSAMPILASDEYVAVKTPIELALGDKWDVNEANTIIASYGEGVYAKAWFFYDDQYIYLQYDVYTDLPMANSYVGHDIWNADSIEFALATSSLGIASKWIVGKTESGYHIATRNPKTLIDVGHGVDVEIEATDFGYRGQVIFDLNQDVMNQFAAEMDKGLRFSIMINDSKDGVDRTRVMTLTDNVNDAAQHVPLIFI